MNKVNLKQDLSTIWHMGGEDILIHHVIPYFMGVYLPSKDEKAKGRQEVIYYASKSMNGGFMNSVKDFIPLSNIKYQSLDDLYLQMEAIEGHRNAFWYFISIQGVINRAIKDTREMRNAGQCTKQQFEYIVNHLTDMKHVCAETLRMHKRILEQDGVMVDNLKVLSSDVSKNSQKKFIARGLRILLANGVFNNDD